MESPTPRCLDCNAVLPSDEELYCKACIDEASANSHFIHPEDVPTVFTARSDRQPGGVPVKIVKFPDGCWR